MAIITLGQARKLLAPYAGKSGKCPTSEETRLFVMEVVQRLLHKGANGNLKKWCFMTDTGCFTAPYEMDVPVKVLINDRPDYVWSKWYEFYETAPFSKEDGYTECDPKMGIREEVNQYFTAYDLPTCGAKIFAVAKTDEDKDAHILIQGTDSSGRDVYIEHKGEQIHGEYLSISRVEPKRTKTVWKSITGIQKTKTRNYIRLYWQSGNKTGLLAEYKPEDTNPSYRRFKIANTKQGCPTKVVVLARIKDPDYHHDNDILPITNLSALQDMANAIQCSRNQKINEANYANSIVSNLIDDENQYRRTGEESFDFVFETSPGSNINLV